MNLSFIFKLFYIKDVLCIIVKYIKIKSIYMLDGYMKYYTINDVKYDEKGASCFIENYYKNVKKNTSRYSEIISFVDKEGYILDYGCGWGCFSKLLYEKGNNVLGLDIDKNSIDIARDFIKENHRLKFKHGDIKSIDDGTFDYVISTEVLEHTHNPGNYINECNRVLKKNGYLILSIPNIQTLKHLFIQMKLNKKNLKKINNQDYIKTRDHIQAWNPITLCTLLNSMGFKYEDHIFSMPIPTLFGYIRIPYLLLNKLCYTMHFKFKKEKDVKIDNHD